MSRVNKNGCKQTLSKAYLTIGRSHPTVMRLEKYNVSRFHMNQIIIFVQNQQFEKEKTRQLLENSTLFFYTSRQNCKADKDEHSRECISKHFLRNLPELGMMRVR